MVLIVYTTIATTYKELDFKYKLTQVPDATLGFDLPGNDAKMISTGFNYKIDDKRTIGASYLYTKKDDRTSTSLGGEFTDIKAHVFNIGYKVSF